MKKSFEINLPLDINYPVGQNSQFAIRNSHHKFFLHNF